MLSELFFLSLSMSSMHIRRWTRDIKHSSVRRWTTTYCLYNSEFRQTEYLCYAMNAYAYVDPLIKHTRTASTRSVFSFVCIRSSRDRDILHEDYCVSFKWSMNLDGQRTNRVLLISLLIFVLLILRSMPCDGWHKTLTFVQQSSYELGKSKKSDAVLLWETSFTRFEQIPSEHFLWYEVFHLVWILCHLWRTWNTRNPQTESK